MEKKIALYSKLMQIRKLIIFHWGSSGEASEWSLGLEPDRTGCDAQTYQLFDLGDVTEIHPASAFSFIE